MENNNAILEGLNSEQKTAVENVDGPVLIVAGAGSGKTRVLTARIAYLLQKGCDPARILALTFTKKAATEMKERVDLMVGGWLSRRLCMGTFHSVFIRFLRDYADSLGYPKSFTIYDTKDSESAIKTCVKELGLDEKIYKPREVLSRISMAKNNLITPAAYGTNTQLLQADSHSKKPKIYDIYKLYCQKCRQSGVMDFDDILLNMNILLRDNAAALENIAGRFDYIMVDEYQDTNYSQYLIIKKLSKWHRNICVVGDDSQSIYAFRGAKIENILNFKKDYQDCKVFRLERNYRSTKTIVNAANSLIEKNKGRIPKECYSEAEDGEKIRLLKGYTEQDEALQIASNIISRIREDRVEYKDFAILYRTNAQSRALEEALRKRNLPYRIYSGNSFYERAEVKDLMAYFKLAVNINDDESFKRIVNKPARGIGDTSLAALIAAAHNKGCSLMQAAAGDDLESFGLKPAAVGRIRQFAGLVSGFAVKAAQEDVYSVAVNIATDSGIYLFYKSDNSVEGQSKAGNVEELLNSVKAYVEERNKTDFDEMVADGLIEEGAEVTAADLPVVTMEEYLENVSLLSAVDMESDEDSANRISLMTVHSAKGLEFPYVFVAGMEENLFPSGGWLASEADIEEERRLFYVAITRAKKMVWLTFVQERMRNGKRENNSPSRFIKEVDSQYIANPLLAKDDDDPWDSDSSSDSSFGRSLSGGSPFGRRSSAGSSGNSYGSGNGSSYGAGRGGFYGAGNGSARRFGTEKSAPQSHSSAGTAAGKSATAGYSSTGPAAGKSGVTGSAPQHPLVDFVPNLPLEFKAGQVVEHNKFGFGTILEISGSKNDRRAKIKFDAFGEKVLLLGYAKLRIIKD